MRALVVEIAGIPMAVVAIAIAVSKVAVAAAYVFGAVKHKCHILEYPPFGRVLQCLSNYVCP